MVETRPESHSSALNTTALTQEHFRKKRMKEFPESSSTPQQKVAKIHEEAVADKR